MSEAFPQKIEKEEFKQYMQSAYKAGVVDSIDEAMSMLKQFINNENNVFPNDYKLGFDAALQLLNLFKTQAVNELAGKTVAEENTEEVLEPDAIFHPNTEMKEE